MRVSLFMTFLDTKHFRDRPTPRKHNFRRNLLRPKPRKKTDKIAIFRNQTSYLGVIHHVRPQYLQYKSLSGYESGEIDIREIILKQV